MNDADGNEEGPAAQEGGPPPPSPPRPSPIATWSTSTQWPSAPSSPRSSNSSSSNDSARDVSNLQAVLDRALHDPFSPHDDVASHLKSNVRENCRLAAEKIYGADVLLAVTGAGFSADSGLATYVDVANVEAYESRGWKYMDLCKPPTFTDFSGLEKVDDGGEATGGGGVREGGMGEENASAVAADEAEDSLKNSTENGDKIFEGEEKGREVVPAAVDADGGNHIMELDADGLTSNGDYHQGLEHCPQALPDEDDIDHPQYFYGFWGQCCNDYRRVRPHDGYDILARWGRDKNAVPKKEREQTSANDGSPATRDEDSGKNDGSVTAREIRKLTRMLERSGTNNDSEVGSSSGSEYFQFEEDDEDEPYYVSPSKRAGAFFLFTSNVDAHSFDVFESHEIRECHGNVEMWQCNNFACGTKDTALANGGSLNRSLDEDDGDACNGSDDENRRRRARAGRRRLWRLPRDHRFLVDTDTMRAPYAMALSKGQSAERALTTGETEGSSSSPPAFKRRKSSVPDGHNDEGAASSGNERGKQGCIKDVNDDSRARAAPPEESEGEDEDANETATALGGIMEDALRNHLANGVIGGKGAGNDNCDGASGEEKPAHVGDVHGKPRLFPLKYMYPTSARDSLRKDEAAQNYYLPIAENENWPRCPRCREAARPAVLMFGDLDWVYNLAQERRWQRWCSSLLRLCKLRGRGGDVGAEDGASTVSGTDVSENGWEEVTEKPTVDEEMEEPTKEAAAASTTLPQPASSERPDDATMASSPTLDPSTTPLKVTILEIGCGYNVPTCRVIAERLVGELAERGGDAALVRINPSHPEPDDEAVENLVVSIMEKGLPALKMIDEHYRELVNEEGGSP